MGEMVFIEIAFSCKATLSPKINKILDHNVCSYCSAKFCRPVLKLKIIMEIEIIIRHEKCSFAKKKQRFPMIPIVDNWNQRSLILRPRSVIEILSVTGRKAKQVLLNMVSTELLSRSCHDFCAWVIPVHVCKGLRPSSMTLQVIKKKWNYCEKA